MAVSFVAAGAGADVAASPNDIAVPYPAGLAADDLMIVHLFSRNTISTLDTIPSGWTLLFGPDASSSHRQWLYYKFATGSESGTMTWSISGAALFMGRCFAFRGVALSSFTEGGGVGDGTDASIEIPSVTTTGSGEMAVAFISVADDNALGDATGESGGNYAEAAAEFTSSLGLDGSMQLQTATMASAGTVSGGVYTMAASDAWVCRAFALTSAAVDTVPGAPTLDSAVAGDTEVDLTWTAPADDGGDAITNYKIYRGTTAGGETLHDTVGNVLTYNDTGLTNLVRYYYKVSAVNGVGEGAQSNERSALPNDAYNTSMSGVSSLCGYVDALNGCPITILAYIGDDVGDPVPGIGPLRIVWVEDDGEDQIIHTFAVPTGIIGDNTPATTGYTGDDGYASVQVTTANFGENLFLAIAVEGEDPAVLDGMGALTANWSSAGDPCQSLTLNAPVLTADSPASPGTDADLDWTASVSCDVRTVVEYAVLRDTSSPVTEIADGLTATDYNDAGPLTPGTTYYYKVRTSYRHPGHALQTVESNVVSVVAGEGEGADPVSFSLAVRIPLNAP